MSKKKKYYEQFQSQTMYVEIAYEKNEMTQWMCKTQRSDEKLAVFCTRRHFFRVQVLQKMCIILLI